MLTRGRLVGVIDVQSTRLGAYQEDDRSMLRLTCRPADLSPHGTAELLVRISAANSH